MKIPNRLFLKLSLLSLMTLVGQGTASASPWADEVKLKVDENVKLHFANESQVGLVVGVVKGSETHFWSYGEAELRSGRPVDADTYFEMGSITKTFTATLLAMEVLSGNVALQDPVSKFWKELEGLDAGKITLQELASHTSGLPRMPTNFVMSDPLDPYKDYDANLLFQFLKDFRQAVPGPYLYAYSNVGIGLLGYLLAEKLNSLSYADYLESSLLKPLALSNTKTKLAASNFDSAAKGYDSFFSLVPFWNLNVLEGAGVLKTTARDLLKFLEINMNTDLSLIGRAMSLAQNQLFPSDVAGTTVGLVWSGMSLGRYNVLAHGGATGGYRANLIFDKSEKLGAVVLSNTDISPTCILAPVFEVPCEVPVYQVVKPATQGILVGKFEAAAIGLKAEVFVEGGKLGIHPEGQTRLRLWAKSELEYYIPDAKAEVIFQKSGLGAVEQFELKQGGQTFVFKRL